MQPVSHPSKVVAPFQPSQLVFEWLLGRKQVCFGEIKIEVFFFLKMAFMCRNLQNLKCQLGSLVQNSPQNMVPALEHH